MATGTIPFDGIIIEECSVDNITLAENAYVNQNITIEKTGYTPIGIVGFRVTNASSSGSNATFCYVGACFLINETTARVMTKNANGNNSAKVKIVVWVMYRKN